MVILTLATGARKIEIVSLHWNDVDLKRGLLIFETKNGERRYTHLSESHTRTVVAKMTAVVFGE